MKHYIIVKFNDQVSDKVGIVEDIIKLFDEAKKIDGITSVEVHVSNMDLPNRHDLMIWMDLTPEALKTFDNSEIHKQWKSQYGRYILNKTIFDCD